MITRHKLVLYFIIVCSLIVEDAESAGAIDDCKKIDNQKFKELFQFSYKGGPKGLNINLDFVGNSQKFKIENCEFSWIEGKFFAMGRKNFVRMQQKTKLSSLQPCTKYRVEVKIRNLASKADFTYENFVTTKPESSMSLELIAGNIGDTFVTFKTKTDSADACFVQYHLSVKNDLKEIIFDNSTLVEKNMNLTSLLASKSYTAQIIAYDDKGSKIQSKAINFKTKSNSKCNEIDPNLSIDIRNIQNDSVRLKWPSDSPENIYHIEILDSSGISIFTGNFSNNSATIDNLKACREYTARLSIPCATKVTTKAFKTLKSRPGEVQEINLNSNHTHSIISWTPPEINVDCVLSYFVEVQKQKVTVEHDKTSLVLPKLPYAMKLSIHVHVNWNTSTDEIVKISEFEHIDFSKFIADNIAEFRLSPSELQLRWNFKSMEILKKFEIFHNGKLYVSNNTIVNLEIDACGKNYTITIRSISSDGNFGPNTSYHTNLDDDSVPLSAISLTDFSFTQTNELLMISWMPIENEALCIHHYDVQLNDQNFKTQEPKAELKDYLPCLTYRIQVTPITEKGTRGESTNYEFTTKAIAPKPSSTPEMIKNGNHEFKISTTLSHEDKYCASLSPTFVIFECNGKRVEEKIEDDNGNHAAIIPNLEPNQEYKCTAFIRNSEGISGVSKVAVFRTLEDSPEPPSNINYLVTADNSIDVNWSPDNSSSFIVYNLHLTLKKIFFEQSNNCPNILQHRSINTTEHRYLFQNLSAYVEYSLRIFAINGNGKSNSSNEIIILTNPSIASPVRDVKIDMKNFSNSSIMVKWEPPCYMNGKFSLYMVSIEGKRKGYKSHKDVFTSKTKDIELKNIKPGYEYDLIVQAKVHKFEENGDIIGEETYVSFLAPSGIPLKEDLDDWVTNFPIKSFVDPSNIEMVLKRRIFMSSVGDIKGIAFLIFLANCPNLPQPSFDYLSSENNVFPPASQGNLNCSKLYQQTEILKNELILDSKDDSSLDDYNVLYVIGDEKCVLNTNSSYYCNGPLLPGLEYGVMARVFTADTFRDTQPVFFSTKFPDFPLMSPVVMVASSLISILLISTIICLCCWCSMRKQSKFKKKKETAETVDNLLSFTSYCVIDKNPVPRGQFDHLL